MAPPGIRGRTEETTGHAITHGASTVPDLPVRAHVPQLAPGVELLGEYQGSGLTEATYLVRNPGGQVVQVSRLLHLVLSGIDGRRTVSEIAARVSAAFGRTVSAGNIELPAGQQARSARPGSWPTKTHAAAGSARTRPSWR